MLLVHGVPAYARSACRGVAAITVHDSSSVGRKHEFCRGLRYLSMPASTTATLMTFVGAGFFVVCKNRRARLTAHNNDSWPNLYS
jgi:hypothetical protein